MIIALEGICSALLFSDVITLYPLDMYIILHPVCGSLMLFSVHYLILKLATGPAGFIIHQIVHPF